MVKSILGRCSCSISFGFSLMRFHAIICILILVVLLGLPAICCPLSIVVEIQSPADRFVILADQETTLAVLRKRMTIAGVASPEVKVLDDNRFSVAIPEDLYSPAFVRDLISQNALSLYNLTSVRSDSNPIAPFSRRDPQGVAGFVDAYGKSVSDARVLADSSVVQRALRLRGAKVVSQNTVSVVELELMPRTRTSIVAYLKDHPEVLFGIVMDGEIIGVIQAGRNDTDLAFKLPAPTAAEARALAARLNAGSFPLPLKREK